MIAALGLLALAVAIGAVLYARHLDGQLHEQRLKATAALATAHGCERTLRESTRRLYQEIDAVRLGAARADATRLMPAVPDTDPGQC